jgi:hypothetical protein
MKTKQQYKLEALMKVRKLNLKKKRKKAKLFSKISSGNYLIRMIKQERK